MSSVDEGGNSNYPASNSQMESAHSTPNASNVDPNGAMKAPQMPNHVNYNNLMGSSHQVTSRNGSPVMRPPSSASIGSAGSYHTAATNNGSGQQYPQQQQQNHPMARFHSSNTPPIGGGGYGHHSLPPHGHFNRPQPRYPMPPRSNRGGGNNAMHMVRSGPGRPVAMGNSYNAHHHYPQHHGYGPMPPHYEYHQSNYSHPDHPQQQQQGHLPPPPPPTAPSPMQTENEKQLSKENQDTIMKESQQQAVFKQEQAAETTQEEDPSASNPSAFESRNPAGEASGSNDVAAAQRNAEQDVSMRQVDPQQQYHSFHQEQQHYHPHQGYHREPHYHQSSFPSHQPYSHHQQHGMGYGQHGAAPHAMRYGNYHHGAGVGGVSPPPPQAAMQYHPSDYNLGPAAVGHHAHYAIHPQEHQYYQNHHGYGNQPPQGAFQLPNYTARRGSYNPSPETTMDAQVMSRSPSPPPKPPAQSPQPKPALLDKTGKPISSDCSESSKTALGERGQNSVKDGDSTVKVPGKNLDGTADAASILLQLAAPVVKPGEAENENPQMANDGTKGKDPIPQSVPGASSMDEASEMTHPDLTSEPSHDSVEQTMQNRVLDTEFPCPIPAKYPTRLCLPYDGAKLNSLHCFLRSDLLEIFVVQKSSLKSPTHSPHSSIGRVGLRCVHCAMNHRSRDDREEAPMAVFYPKSVAEIYRLVTSWQRCHLRKCHNLPPAVRAKWLELRETDKSRGKTHYWVTSAKEIGLRDCQGRAGGIRFAADLDGNNLPPQTRPATYNPPGEIRTSPRSRIRLPVQPAIAAASPTIRTKFQEAMDKVQQGDPPGCKAVGSASNPKNAAVL